MSRPFPTGINPKELMLDNILAVMSSRTFGRTVAERIVGGRRRLDTLIAEGKIEAVRLSGAQNGKWQCNAAQVLQHCRDMR